MKSMTGFGRAIIENEILSQQWEVRSVNSKRLDLKWTLPSSVRSLEGRFEKVVKQYAVRGRVDISLSLQFLGKEQNVSFNAPLAEAMIASLQELAERRGEIYEPDYDLLLTVESLWENKEAAQEEEIAELLEKGLALALEDWNESRTIEGLALCRDLSARILRMEQWTDLITERAPLIKEERIANLRERLSERVESLKIGEIEESRFLQEIIILVDRIDVTEELTRLATHLERLRELLQEESDAGRRLDFTLQECFREINTCGNKTPEIHLSRIIVDYKNELEKCREQAQNLE